LWVAEPDNHDQLTPVGTAGELLIEGPNLARCYLDDPEKTQASFIENPAWLPVESFGKRRLYKTGDLVIYNENGTVDYVGRKDTQVKLHGQRIELGEIEFHLTKELENVRQAAAEMVSVQGHQLLAAFIQLGTSDKGDGAGQAMKDGYTLSLSGDTHAKFFKLQARLSGLVPAFMVPSVYIAMQRMPVNASGKLDRKLLRQIVSQMPEPQLVRYTLADAEKRTPSTALEAHLQTLFAEVLDVTKDSVGADDSFFRLGGDSIIAMKLVTAAQAAGLPLTVAMIFGKPQLSRLAQELENLASGPATSTLTEIPPFSLLADADLTGPIVEESATLCGIDKADVEDVYPCTPLQEGLISISARRQGAYIARMVFRFPNSANVDLDHFKGAWQKAMDRYAILRTRIVHTKAGGSLQVVIRSESCIYPGCLPVCRQARTHLPWQSVGSLWYR
jgi:aryl carrier-like protein